MNMQRKICRILNILFLFLLISCNGNLSDFDRNRYKPNTRNIDEKERKFFSNSSSYNTCKGGYYKIGQPYKVFGRTYYPKNYKEFTEIGMASWYGKDFHNKKTANGEKYNMNDMTAAHKTLPLPSIIKVINLENGKSAIVRVNDRGPFNGERILDVSKKVAKELEFKDKGLTRVKIELLRKETDKYLKKCNFSI